MERRVLPASSRLMLVVYPIFFLAIGGGYVLGDPSRSASPSYDYVRGVMPISHWGIGFLAIAAIYAAAWWSPDRRAMVLALCLGFGISIAWAAGFLFSAIDLSAVLSGDFALRPGASLIGVTIWMFVAMAHIASLRSVTIDAPALRRG